MRKNQLLMFAAASLLVASSASAQWSVTGTVVHPTVLNNNVSVGTNVNGANFYVEKAAAVTLGIKSQTAGATMFMDKGAAAANAAFAYKVGGVTTWNSGMLGSNNFSIRNVGLNTFPIVVNVANDNTTLCNTTGNVGIGTLAPTTKLHVIGSGRIEGNLQVTNNSTFGASMNVSGNITSTGNINAANFIGTGNLDVSGYVGFGSVEQLTDGGGFTIASNSNFVPLDSNNRDLGSNAKKWKDLYLGGNATIGGTATIAKGATISGGINVLSGNISSGGDLYTSSGNGVINCGGDSMSAIINVMADAFTPGTSNLNADGDEDLYIGGDLEVVGKGYQTGGGAWGVRSDSRLKKDINNFTDGLEQLMKIRPVTFKYNSLMPNATDQEYVGIIAQEMQEIAPYMVSESPMGRIVEEDENGKEVIVKQGTNYLSYDPNALWYITVNAIKDQQAIIEKQAARIEALESKLGIDATERKANNNSTLHLEQNQPNPFNQSTTINFNCGDAKTASILIRDLSGNLIKSIDAAGKTSVTINANELMQGTYTYTLQIANTSIDTKLMVVTK